MISKKLLFQIISAASREQVTDILTIVTDNHKCRIIREAQKILVMVKMREPVGESLFYIGEVLCCECIAEVNDKKGIAVLMGDDFEKATAAAIIDAALNAKIYDSELIEKKMLNLLSQQEAKRAPINAQIMKSKVNFNVMGE